MAKQTRQQRRARRQEQGGGDGSVVQRARSRQQQVRPAAQPPKSQTGARRAPGTGARRFVAESWGELKKVDWPNQRQVMQGVVVVIIACVIVGIYLYAADEVFKRLVQKVLLK